MPSIADYLKYAETAFAAYAENLKLGTDVNVDAYIVAKMSSAQAKHFDAAWKVLAQKD